MKINEKLLVLVKQAHLDRKIIELLSSGTYTQKEIVTHYRHLYPRERCIHISGGYCVALQIYKSSICVRLKLHKMNAVYGDCEMVYENFVYPTWDEYLTKVDYHNKIVTKRNQFAKWHGKTNADGSMSLPGLFIRSRKDRPGLITFAVCKLFNNERINVSYSTRDPEEAKLMYLYTVRKYLDISPYTDMPEEWLVYPTDRVTKALENSYGN